MVLAVAAAGTSVAADGGLVAGFQSDVKATVLITSFSFAVYVAARITRAAKRARRPRDPRRRPNRLVGRPGR
jgi:zinc/manganese transport system permease protein